MWRRTWDEQHGANNVGRTERRDGQNNEASKTATRRADATNDKRGRDPYSWALRRLYLYLAIHHFVPRLISTRMTADRKEHDGIG